MASKVKGNLSASPVASKVKENLSVCPVASKVKENLSASSCIALTSSTVHKAHQN